MGLGLLWWLEVEWLEELLVDYEGSFDVDFFGDLDEFFDEDLGWDFEWNCLIFYDLHFDYLFHDLFNFNFNYFFYNYLSIFPILLLASRPLIS